MSAVDYWNSLEMYNSLCIQINLAHIKNCHVSLLLTYWFNLRWWCMFTICAAIHHSCLFCKYYGRLDCFWYSIVAMLKGWCES